jgi:hypothetical protein
LWQGKQAAGHAVDRRGDAPVTVIAMAAHSTVSHACGRSSASAALVVAGHLRCAGSRSGGASGTPSAWETPPAAPAHRRLLLSSGFAVIDGQQRRLYQRARQLGFPDLRSYLQDRCDAGHSVPTIGQELALSQGTVSQALTRLQISLPSRGQRLALQRRRRTDRRIATQAGELGSASIAAYLADRATTQAWLLADIAGELGADPATVRRRWTSTPSGAPGAPPGTWLLQRFPPPEEVTVQLFEWGNHPRVIARTAVQDLLAIGP